MSAADWKIFNDLCIEPEWRADSEEKPNPLFGDGEPTQPAMQCGVTQITPAMAPMPSSACCR